MLGYLQLVDRAKDLIKSGGEWISSVEVETLVAGCPGVAAAAVIGVKHRKWDERPLLVIVKSCGATVERRDILHCLNDKIVKSWMPVDVGFLDSLPITAKGKISKLDLRRRVADHLLTKT